MRRARRDRSSDRNSLQNYQRINPTIPCPECDGEISIDLLGSRPGTCSKCRLELLVDIERSRDALEAFKTLNDGLDKAKEAQYMK